MTEAALETMERVACSSPETDVKQMLRELLIAYRGLVHELKDERYLYAGARINRMAIVCRDAENTELQKKIVNLRGKLAAHGIFYDD